MTTKTQTLYRSYIIEEYHLINEPYYVPIGDEVELFEVAYKSKIPVLFKGPTGCGKTRFVEYMSYRLRQPMTRISQNDGASSSDGDGTFNGTLPLVTIACHEDLTASDLVGRYLLQGEETIWIDGPLTRAVKAGGICYLDEIVEARKDTTVLIHPLTDHRRILPVEKKGRALGGRGRVPAGDVLQPRLPERVEGPQTQHAPAVCRHRVRLSTEGD